MSCGGVAQSAGAPSLGRPIALWASLRARRHVRRRPAISAVHQYTGSRPRPPTAPVMEASHASVTAVMRPTAISSAGPGGTTAPAIAVEKASASSVRNDSVHCDSRLLTERHSAQYCLQHRVVLLHLPHSGNGTSVAECRLHFVTVLMTFRTGENNKAMRCIDRWKKKSAKSDIMKPISGDTVLSIIHGPATTVHFVEMSKFVNHEIDVWVKDRVLVIGSSSSARQPHPRRLNVGHRSSAGRAGGHFTLNGGLEPRNLDAGCHPDNCGFDVVSDQTGYPASLLRRIIVQRMLVRLYQSRLRGRDHRFQCSRCRRAFIMRVSRSTINSCNL
ncbi:unnamed protein product [Trichogramma brassicae]|uniref:Uncharacterized protein n=1 Tax=Trichogramma brassicae TaxID=86971 RepID=A0A6H5HZE2_9HYME|nr:unnamed protein product [Trichogramma brassicae]